MKKTFLILSLIFTLISNTTTANEFVDMLRDAKNLYHEKKWLELKVKRAEFLTKAYAVIDTKTRFQTYHANLEKMDALLKQNKSNLFFQLATAECFDLFVPKTDDRPAEMDEKINIMRGIFLGEVPAFIRDNNAEWLYYRHILLMARAFFMLARYDEAEELLDNLSEILSVDLKTSPPTQAFNLRNILIGTYDLNSKIKQKQSFPNLAVKYNNRVAKHQKLIASDPLPLTIKQEFNNELVLGYVYNFDLITMMALLNIQDYRNLYDILLESYGYMYDKNVAEYPYDHENNERRMIAFFKADIPDKVKNLKPSAWMFFTHAFALAEYYYYMDQISVADEILAPTIAHLKSTIINTEPHYELILNRLLIKALINHAAVQQELGKFDDVRTSLEQILQCTHKIKLDNYYEYGLLAVIDFTGKTQKIEKLVYNFNLAENYFKYEDASFHQLQLLRATYNHLLPQPKTKEDIKEMLGQASAYFTKTEDAYHRGLALYQLSKLYKKENATKSDEYYWLARDVAQKKNIPLLDRQLQKKPYQINAEFRHVASSPQLLLENEASSQEAPASCSARGSSQEGEYESASNCGSYETTSTCGSTTSEEQSEDISASDNTSLQIAATQLVENTPGDGQTQALNLSPGTPRTPPIANAESSKENNPPKLREKTKISFQSQEPTQGSNYQEPKRRKPLETVPVGNTAGN